MVAKIYNFKKKKQESKLATKVKTVFSNIQKESSELTTEEYRDFIMLLLADLIVCVLRSGWYTEPAKAIKKGVDLLHKRFG